MSVRSIVGVWTLALLAAAGASLLSSRATTSPARRRRSRSPSRRGWRSSRAGSSRGRGVRRTGPASRLILVGFAWFLAALPSAEQPLLFTLGLLFNGLFIGFLAHLLLAFPSGRLTTRVERVVAAAMYVVVTVFPFFALLFDEGEISSTACERGTCPENLLATFPAQTFANVLVAIFGIGAGSLSIAVAVLLIRRWRRASPALRVALNPDRSHRGVLIATFAVQIARSASSRPRRRE